jgi:hypothetical protein
MRSNAEERDSEGSESAENICGKSKSKLIRTSEKLLLHSVISYSSSRLFI